MNKRSKDPMSETSVSGLVAGDGSPLARLTDPSTSHEAVASQPLSELRRIVLSIYGNQAGDRGMTDSELNAFYENNFEAHDWPRVREQTPRKRRSDLAGLGLLRDSGAVEMNPYGRNETVWEISALGRQVLDGEVQS